MTSTTYFGQITAVLTAATLDPDTGLWLYDWQELGTDERGLSVVTPDGRSGTYAPAVEINNQQVEVGTVVMLRSRSVVAGKLYYEFNAGVGGGSAVDLVEIDGPPNTAGFQPGHVLQWSATSQDFEPTTACEFFEPNHRTVPTGYRLLGLLFAHLDDTDRTPLYTGDVGASSGTDGFWAKLTAKVNLDGCSPTYSWTQVLDSDGACPLDWADLALSGGPGHFPAYHVNDIDLPVVEPDTLDAHPFVVWLRRGDGDYYLIDVPPDWEFCEKTADRNEEGYYPSKLLRVPPGSTGSAVQVEDCWLIEINGP